MSTFKVGDSKGEFVAVNTEGKYVTTDAGKFVIFNAETNSFRQVDEIIDADGNSFQTNSEDLSDFAADIGDDDADEAAAAKEYWLTPIDVEGATDVTELLLHVMNRREFIEQFKSPKIKKKEVWKQISQRMEEYGFPANAGTSNCDSGRKCNQKWTNLLKGYNKYQKVLAAAGPPRRPPPKYYHFVDKLVTQIKQPVNNFPSNFLSSLTSKSNSVDSSIVKAESSSSSEPHDGTLNSSLTVEAPAVIINTSSPPRSPSSSSSSSDSYMKFSRPKTKKKVTAMQKILKVVKEEMKLQAERHQQQLKILEDFIRNAEKSKEEDKQLKIRMVTAIETVCQSLSRKRKRDSADDLEND